MKKVFSSLTNAYMRAVEQEWSFLSMGGDAVPLDRVYVMLETLTSPKPHPQEPCPDLPDVPERQEHAGLADFPKPKPSSSPLPLPKVLAEARHMSLLGEAGSGKSTTLQFIGLCFARPGWAKAKLALDEPGVPVLVRLGETSDRLQRVETRLLDGVVMPIVRGLLPEGTTEAETHDVVMDWMSQGRLVLLLDGLDEVSNETVRKRVTLFASDENGRKCRIVLSSRPAGYSSPGGEFCEYRLKPFEKPEEVRSYLRGWLATLRPEWEPQAEDKARTLLDEMGCNPALKRITDNPLLLRLAAEGYAADERVAHSRADLYRRYVETVAWQRRESIRQTPPEQKTAALATLEASAWKLQQGSQIPWDDNDPQQVLLRRQLGLLAIYIDASKVYLTFSHTTFREYFIARHLAKAWLQKDNRDRAWAILRAHLHDPAWREPLLLLAGMLEKETVTDLVQRVLKTHSRYEKELLRNLRLAAAMANECGENNLNGSLWKELQKRLQVSILQISDISLDAIRETGAPAVPALSQATKDEDKSVRRWAVDVLGEIGDPQSVPALLQALNDEDVFVRRKAAEVLGEIGDPQAIPGLVRALGDEDEEARRSADKGLSKIGAPAIPALLQALKEENWRVRWTAAEALGEIGDPQSVPALLQALKGENFFVYIRVQGALLEIGAPAVPALLRTLEGEDKLLRSAAAEALGEIGDPRAVPALLQVMTDEDKSVRRSAAEALGKIGDPQAMPALLQAMKDEDEDPRQSAVSALGRLGDPQSVPALLQALNDEEMFVRQKAAEALGKIGDPQAVVALLQATKDKVGDVCKLATEALGKIGAPAVPALLQATKDEDRDVRKLAAEALGKIGDPQAVVALLQATKDEDRDVRWLATEALGKIGAPAVPALLQTMKNEDSHVRWLAVIALSEIGAPAVPALLRTLAGEDRLLRSPAAEALGELGDPQAVPALLQAMKDEDKSVRWSAAKALGKIGVPQAVPALLQATRDEDSDARWSAAKALGKIGVPQAVPALLQALNEKDVFVRREAAEVLQKFGDPRAAPVLLEAMKDEDMDVRHLAAEALGKIGAPAVPALLQAMKDEDRSLHWSAAHALQEISDPQAVPALLQALNDEDMFVRQKAAEALGEIGDPQAALALLQATKDEDSHVRRSAASALGEISDRVNDTPILKDIAIVLCRAKKWKYLETVANRLEALQAGQHPLPDPLVVLPIPTWQRSLIRFGRGIAWAVVSVILGWVLLFSGVLGDLLKSQWKTALQTWAAAHPGTLFGLVTIALLIGGLLTLGVDALKKK